MFQKTKWRLTLLNTIVVALILSLLSLTLYFFMKNEISHRIDRDLSRELEQEASTFKPMRPREFDSRTVIIYYLSDGRVVTKPKIELTDEFFNKISPAKVSDKFDTRLIDGYQYRIATIEGSGTVEYVQVVRNIHSEYEQLYVLKWVLIFGSIFGCLLAFGIGYFLAKYSLIPIQRSWNQQKRFVGDASHELRTPIAVIQSGAEQLLQDPEKSVLYHSENVNRMLKETRRMNRLISDLLLLAKTDSDQIVIDKQRVNVYEIVEDVADYFEDVAMLKNILFNVVCQDEVYANVDKEKIQQLLINLLDNAMKYTNEEGSVVLKVSTAGQKLVIQVKDSGIGIAPEHHDKLFDRFYRIDKARTRGEERGHGLGLSIVKWIVDSHDGTIEVKSELGKGTEFIVSLPIK
ncbi:MAG: sensor histidine kinase [Bacillaceae bacterium]